MKKLVLGILLLFSVRLAQGQCIVDDSLDMIPPPTAGCYYPGDSVTFTLFIMGYQQMGSNWLHGVELNFGTGWDKNSVKSIQPAYNCGGQGEWYYYDSIFASGSHRHLGKGFYFEAFGDPDFNPGNNYGDYTSSGTCWWLYTWRVWVDSLAVPGSALVDSIVVMGDGTSGFWSSNACNESIHTNLTVCNTATKAYVGSKTTSDVRVYSAPGEDYFTINVTAPQAGDAKVSVVNTLGQQVMNTHHTINTGYNQWQVPFHPAAAGVYFVNVEQGGRVVTRKIIF